MKTFQRLLSKLWYIFICVFIVSCSEKDDLVIPEPVPEPVPTETNYLLKEGVVEIEGNDLKYIVEAQEGSILVLSNDFPSGTMPSVGEIVFVYPNAEKLAHGFLGKVSKIEQLGDKYHLITEQVALDEAFSYLLVDETIDFEPVSVDGKSASRIAVEEINGYNSLTQGIDLTFDIKKYLELKVKGKLTLGMRIRSKVHIDDSKNKKEQYIYLSMYASFNPTIQFTCSVDGDKIPKLNPVEKPINNLKFKIPAGVVSLFVCPEIVPKFVVDLDAALNAGIGIDFSCEETFVVASKDGKWSFEHDKSASVQNEPILSLLPQGLISMEGSAFAGIAISPEVKLFGRDDMKISINPAVGLKGKAEINYNLGTDKSLYDALKDDEFTTSLALQAYVKADANIFKWKAEWSADLLDLNFFPVTRYLFPSFSNHSLAYANGEIFASTNLGRDLLWKQDVGLALYKGDERIEVSEPVKYQLEDDFEKRNPLEKMFEGVPEDKKNEYSVWSYVKWGDFYVKCEQLTPNKKIKKLSKRWVEDGNFIDYSFYYTNDHISNIEIYDGYDLNKWTFKYLDNGHISVDGSNNVGGFSGTLTYSIELNDDGFMQSCIQQNNGGADDSWTIHWWFKYNEEGQLVYVNNSRNESWSFSYQDSNAVSVSGSDDISISYGNLEAEGSWIFLDWMYGIDFENDMGIFGLLGLLGKPSKNLPSSNSGENYPWRFNWSLNDDGYPDFLSATIENDPRTMSFSWE